MFDKPPENLPAIQAPPPGKAAVPQEAEPPGQVIVPPITAASHDKSERKKYFLIGLLGLAAVVTIVVFMVVNSDSAPTVTLDTSQTEDEADKIPPRAPIQQSDETVVVGQPDRDFDGLTDFAESQLGTDPDVFDTDQDGLSDGQEVEQYNSNPLEVDTDQDGFTDAEEVNNGYDPAGVGRL